MISLPDLAGFKTIAIAVVASLAIGFGAGFYTATRFDKANLVDGYAVAKQMTAQNILNSALSSAKVDSALDSSDKNIDSIRDQVTARFIKWEKNEKNCTSKWTLDMATVGMLNNARAGGAVSTATISDDQGSTPSDITAAEFIDNDLQVVKLYQKLAIRHNALVDYVDELVRRQAAN